MRSGSGGVRACTGGWVHGRARTPAGHGRGGSRAGAYIDPPVGRRDLQRCDNVSRTATQGVRYGNSPCASDALSSILRRFRARRSARRETKRTSNLKDPLCFRVVTRRRLGPVLGPYNVGGPGLESGPLRRPTLCACSLRCAAKHAVNRRATFFLGARAGSTGAQVGRSATNVKHVRKGQARCALSSRHRQRRTRCARQGRCAASGGRAATPGPVVGSGRVTGGQLRAPAPSSVHVRRAPPACVLVRAAGALGGCG